LEQYNMSFRPSKYQQAIFDTYKNTKHNIAISAVPGSGKSTTIIELLKFVPYNRDAIFLAFNKSIVEELEKKVPQRVDVMTIHSLGAKALFREFKGQVEVSEYKIFRIAKHISHKFSVDKKKIDSYIFNISKILDLYRLRLENNYEAIDTIISHYNIDCIGNERVDSIKVFEEYLKYNEEWSNHGAKFTVDFTDMVYLPAVKNYKLKMYDDVFIDESQDLNAAQQKLVDKIIKSVTGRFVAVGDPRQSIYGFMSADAEAYSKFAKKPNTIELPLSYCYRCGKNIVAAANQIWNVIESPDWMHEGKVHDKGGSIENIKEGDFVLCRNNKPLVELYFKLLKQEKVAYIKGSEIGKSIINLIKQYEHLQKDQLIVSLYDSLSNLHKELSEKGISKPTAHPRYVSFSEKIEIIKVVANNYTSTKAISKAIEKMFSDVSKGIMLSSIHKSKGLEADNVYILDISLIPSEYAVQDHEIIQEYNLLYVAITRAKQNLYFI